MVRFYLVTCKILYREIR